MASRVGGLPDIVQHNVNGFLAEPQDELDLAQWLMTLLSSAQLRSRLGREGRAGLNMEFSWREVAEQFVRLYRDIRIDGNETVPPEASKLKFRIQETAEKVDPAMSFELRSLFEKMPVP